MCLLEKIDLVTHRRLKRVVWSDMDFFQKLKVLAMVIDLYLLVLGHTKYKGIDLSTKYKVTVASTKYFLHSYMYLVLGGKYKVKSTWPKVLGPSSITKVTVKYLVTQLQLLYLTQLCL